MSPQIIDETKHWIAINKPAGIQVERNPFEASVESMVYEHLTIHGRRPYVGIVHRIDRPTSGVVLVAKRKSTLKEFNQAFHERQVRKTYLARVKGQMPASEGALLHFLKRDLLNKKAVICEQGTPKAQEAQLRYDVQRQSDGQALLSVVPLTGRYHQIRAQLAAVGCPIIGDERYGSTAIYRDNAIMLHAWQLELPEMGIQLETAIPAWAVG